jgi:hypothetical protein
VNPRPAVISGVDNATENVWGWTADDYKPSAHEIRNRGGIHTWLSSLTLAWKPITGGIREAQNAEEDIEIDSSN